MSGVVALRNGYEMQEIARRLLLGQVTSQIAAEMDLSEQHVRNLCQKQEMQDITLEVEQNVFGAFDEKLSASKTLDFERIERRQSEAFEKLVNLMRHSGDERLQADVAKDILNRGGNTALKGDTVHNTIVIDPILAKQIIQAKSDSRKNEEAIEVESS